jgi:hypothetical protein
MLSSVYEIKVDSSSGTKCWILNNKLHREDGPAIECFDGSKEWWLNNKRHREDGPAIEDSNGYKSWWLNGKRHREDGPAIEYPGPAIEYPGPAIEYPDGIKIWYLSGVNYLEEEWKNKIELENSRIEEVKNLFEPNLILRLKDTNFGYLHFEYKWANLRKEYYLNDETFEYVLDNSPTHVKEELLFHLDIFV